MDALEVAFEGEEFDYDESLPKFDVEPNPHHPHILFLQKLYFNLHPLSYILLSFLKELLLHAHFDQVNIRVHLYIFFHFVKSTLLTLLHYC